jgi:DNA-binding phage protein
MDANVPSQSKRRNDQKAAIMAWLRAIIAAHGNPPTLARKMAAKGYPLSAATLYRMLDEDAPNNPDLDTIGKIEQAFGHPLGVAPKSTAARNPGFAEPEATEIDRAAAPLELTPGLNQGVWRIGSRALDLAGFVPGDLVLFDSSQAPRPGDLVVAQVANRSGETDTVIRLYDPPYLITRSADPAVSTKPLPVDNDRVWIWGVMVRMLRSRRDG